jgi:hypothetical protein
VSVGSKTASPGIELQTGSYGVIPLNNEETNKMEKKKDELEEPESNSLAEDEETDLNDRYTITAKTIMAMEGSIHFDDLALRCDDAYVAADPENHKSDIREARIVLKNCLDITSIVLKGVIRMEGQIIFKEASA